MVRIFYGNRSYALLLVPFLAALFVVLNIFFPHYLPEDGAGFGMWGNILPQTHWLSFSLAPVLIIANGIVLNWIFNRNEFLEKNNFLVAMLYVTFLSNFHSFYFLDGFTIAQFVFGVGLVFFFRLNQNEDARKIVFNVAFLFGIATTFYPLFLIAIPFLFWIIWVVRPFVFRESILTLIGYVIPLVYAGVYSMVTGFKISGDQFSSSSKEVFLIDLFVVGTAVVWFLLFSLKTLFRKMQQGSIRVRKLYNMLLMMVFLSMLLTTVEYLVFKKVETISLIIVPLMFVLPYGFGYKKQRPTPTAFYYLLFLFSVSKFFGLLTF